MSAFYDLASLVLVPSGYKAQKVYAQKPLTTDGQLTFSRASAATRVASNGLIEKVRTNVVLRSEEQSNAQYATVINEIASRVAVANPLTGQNNAYKITSTANNDPYIGQVVTGLSNGENTFSLWLWTDSGQALNCDLFFYNQTASEVYAKNITISTTPTRYTHTVNFTSIGANATVRLDLRQTGPTVQYVYTYGWQAESGAATDYIATTSAAVSVGPVANVPRLDYLNSSCPRLLLEPQRTNLLTYSEQFNNAAYILNNATITANSVVSPDGYTNADTYTAAGSNNYLNAFGSSSGSNTITYSVFVKAGTQSVFRIREAFYFGTTTIFNLSTGTVTSGTGTITSYGNGWYRCTMSQAYGAGQGNLNIIFDTTASSGTFYLYGAQAEVGAYATSYIPTTSSTVTRLADACSKTGISSLIGQTEGTIFVDFNHDISVTAAADSRIQLSDGTAANWIFIGFPDGAAKLLRMYVNSTSGALSFFSNTGVIQGRNKAAFAYKSGDFMVYLNGVQVASNTTAQVIPPCSAINLQGGSPTAVTAERENINQALLFKTRLTNAQLAELTTL